MQTISTERAYAFVNGLKTPAVAAFKDCYEAGMDYDTALGCAGLKDQPALRMWWNQMEINGE